MLGFFVKSSKSGFLEDDDSWLVSDHSAIQAKSAANSAQTVR
jgi:hypothetical protein